MNRDEWNKKPAKERYEKMSKVPPENFDRYIIVTTRLRKRFYRNGGIIVEIDGKPAPYRILEDQAWMKYVVNN